MDVREAHTAVESRLHVEASSVVRVAEVEVRGGSLKVEGDAVAGSVFERVVDQLANHAVENHLHIPFETLVTQVGREANLFVVDGRAAVDEVLNGTPQSEVLQDVGREVVRDFTHRADSLLDDASGAD